MKVLAIINKNFSKKYEDIVVEEIKVENCPVYFALLELEDIVFDDNNKDNEHMVLVKKNAFSLNYRDKGFILSAAKYFEKNPTAYSYFPFGSDFSGIVQQVGAGVKNLQVGDRVISNSAYPFSGHQGVLQGIATNNASKELEVFHHAKLLKVPNTIGFEQAAAITVGAQTSYSMMRRTHVQPTDNVLITAATSNTSLFLLSALKNKCKNIYVISTNEQNKQRLNSLGATHFIFYDKTLQFQDERQQIFGYINKRVRFNVIFDPFNDIYLEKVIDYIDYFGQYITCGVYNQSETQSEGIMTNDAASVTDMLHFAITKNISFIGNCLGTTQDLQQAVLDIENGHLTIPIDSVFEEDDFVGFIQRSYQNKNRFGKVIMRYS